MILERAVEEQAGKCLVLGPSLQNLGRNSGQHFQIAAARA